jgi:hypothetical protein
MRPSLALAITLTLAPALAGAQAPPRYPTKFILGMLPAGGQIAFNANTPGGYRLMIDGAGRVKGWSNGVGAWVGGALNYTYGTYNLGGYHNPQLWVFAAFTFQVARTGLMPYVNFGPAGDIIAAGGQVGGGGGFRFGGGMAYFFTRNIGVAMDTHFTLGGGSFAGGPVGFYGHWDIGFGMKAGL